MVPKSLLNTTIALTSLGATLGFRDRDSDFLEEPHQSTIGQKVVETGIGATTTAATLAGTFYAAARYKNPYLTGLGMALAAGGAYATARIYKKHETQKMVETGSQTPSLSSRLLDGAMQLGALYYGGRALTPFVANSVSRMDMELRPWFKSMGATIDQARLGNIGEWGSVFSENLQKNRDSFSTIDRRFPLQNHLDIINKIRSNISNVELASIAEKDTLSQLMKKYTVGDNGTVNGIRQATLSDAIKAGQAVNYQPILQHQYDPSTIGLGKGVFYDTNAQKIINLHKYTPENILAAATQSFSRNFKIPVLNFNPVSVLRPNELIQATRNRHSFHIFPEGTVLGPTLKAGKSGAAFIGGNLYDMESGNFLTSGLIVKTGKMIKDPRDLSGFGGHAHFRETAFGEILRKRYSVGMNEPVGPGKINFGDKVVTAPTTAFQKFMTNVLEMDIPGIHKTGAAEYPSAYDHYKAVIKKRPGFSGAIDAVSQSFKAIFDPEGLVESTSKVSAYPLTETKRGATAFGFVPHSDLLGTAAFWQAHRPIRLFESLGLGGFNPKTTKSAADVMWKMVIKRALPLYLSYKMLQFSNDMGHKYFNYGIFDIPADLIAGVNVGTAYMRHALGIDDIAQYIEGLMPGSISASGPSLIRGLGIPLLAGAKWGPKGLIGGALASMALGGPTSQILRSPEDIREEYFGNRRVPIKSGRWWEMGQGPFEGGKIKYYVPNWYRRLKSRYQYTDVQYGSEGEYWSNILSPYHYAIKHYNDRPYPLATSGMEEFPFVGPALAGLFAPPMLMHQDYLQNNGNVIGGTAGHVIGTEGIAGGTVVGLGPAGPSAQGGDVFAQPYGNTFIAGTPEQKAPYGAVPSLGGKSPAGVSSPLDLQNRIGQSIYEMNEYAGMYGFLANALKNKVSGQQDFFTGPQLESASRISSAERAYWEKDLGGLFENCFPAGTKIRTSNGWRDIEDINIGETIISIDGEDRRVTNTLTKNDNELYKLHISAIDLDISATKNHHIPIFKPTRHGKAKHLAPIKDSDIILIDTNIQDINPGDYVITPIFKPGDYPIIDISDSILFKDCTITDEYIYTRGSYDFAKAYELLESHEAITRKDLRSFDIPDMTAKEALISFQTHKVSRYTRYIELDKDLAYLVGWWAAEGCITDEGGIFFAFHENEISYTKELTNIIKNKFHCQSKVRKQKSKGIVLQANNMALAALFTILIGRGSHNKFIDHRLKTLPIEGLTALFKGLMLGDGWFNTTKSKAGFTSVSETLVRDLFDIGLTLGYLGNLNCNYIEKASGYYPQGTPRKDYIRNYIQYNRKESVESIIELLESDIYNRPETSYNNKSFIYRDHFYCQVKSNEHIILDNSISVYDLSIEDMHYYCATIVVHNTELFRRFLPHRRHEIDLYNPIPNTQPDWMPGEDYFTNFKIGDPYSKINYGEFRVPGAGYEKFYKKGSGIQKALVDIGASNLDMGDGYSPLDQYRILSDSAPYSQSARYAQEYIMALSKAGGLTSEGEEERKRIRRETSARKKNYQFKRRRFTEGKLKNESVIVGTYLGRGRFTAKGQRDTVYQLAGLKGITPEGEEYINSIIKGGERITVQSLDDPRYRKKTESAIPTIPVLVGPINRNLVRKKWAEYRETGPAGIFDPLNIRVQYNAGERIMGGAWERFSHSNIPFFNKFLHERTALEEYKNTQVYGTGQADWQHPIRDFVMPYVYRAKSSSILSATLGGALLSMFGTNKRAKVALGAIGAISGLVLSSTGSRDYIPGYRKKERDINQYYDILKYLKNERLYNYSRERAIEEEGIDPEEIARSIDASKEARHAVSKAIKEKYGEAALKKLYNQVKGNKKGNRLELEDKRNLEDVSRFLQYQKYTEDEALRLSQGGFTGAALEFRKRYKSTMFGADVHGDFASIMRALPTKEREFFTAFVTAPKEQRKKIKAVAPLGMRRFLEAKWGDKVEENPDLDTYFQDHKLPNDSWIGWHPAVNLDDVKLKTVQQEGLDMHDFNLWESQARQLPRKPYVPLIDPFSSKGNHHNIRRELEDIITAQGYNNYDMYIDDYAGNPDNQISIDVKYATQPQAQEYIKKNIRQLMSPSYV